MKDNSKLQCILTLINNYYIGVTVNKIYFLRDNILGRQEINVVFYGLFLKFL